MGNVVPPPRKIELGPVEWIEVEQNTPEWHLARSGMPTASEFDTVLSTERTKGRGGLSEYRRKLVGERITGQCISIWEGNKHTERGHEMEGQARDGYALLTDSVIKRVGFARRKLNGRWIGASPDSEIMQTGEVVFVGKKGLEVKTKLPHLLIECHEDGVLPTKHKPQVQGIMLVAGWDEMDFTAYWPGLPQFIINVKRDEAYLSELCQELDKFNDSVDALEKRIRELL